MKMKEPCKGFNYGAEIRELELEQRRIAIKKAKLEILERELVLTERAYALSQKIDSNQPPACVNGSNNTIAFPVLKKCSKKLTHQNDNIARCQSHGQSDSPIIDLSSDISAPSDPVNSSLDSRPSDPTNSSLDSHPSDPSNTSLASHPSDPAYSSLDSAPSNPVNCCLEAKLENGNENLLVHSVQSTGNKKMTLYVDNKGEVLKMKGGGSEFYHTLYSEACRLFGSTMNLSWKQQPKEKKMELEKIMTEEYGHIFDKRWMLAEVCKHLHNKRGYIKRVLRKEPKHPREPDIDEATWAILKNEREGRTDGKYGHLKEVTKIRLEKFGKHKLGQGGISSLKASMVRQFGRLPTSDEIRFAVREGFDKLREKKLQSGQKLAE